MTDHKTGDVLFYSEAVDAELGALIYAGPFRELIWVNRHQKAKAALESANHEMSVPADLPPTQTRTSALEAAVLSHVQARAQARRAKAGDDDAPEHDEESGVAPRTEHSPTIFSVTHALLAGPSVSAETVGKARAVSARRAKATLAWRESDLHLPVAVPDEVIHYRRGAESAAVQQTLKEYGVGLTGDANGAANATLRVIIQALAPVNTLDQLAMWRAAEAALVRPA
jgi:hypothetical protein